MSEPQRVLITGAGGQVGRALLAKIAAGVHLRATTHADLDICDADAVARYIADFRPHVIINAAAYTAVDKAEADIDAATQINAVGPANLARALVELNGSRLLHISTDFVFDGRKSSPYRTTDPPAPVGVYGATKLSGEQAVTEILGDRAIIVRTSWVYAPHGRNFVLTMLRLMKDHGVVRVVADQIGSPTSAASLARVLWLLAARRELSGIFHWADAGVASWYDFAIAIAEEARSANLLATDPHVISISTAEYSTAAVRPPFSVLDKQDTITALGVQATHWRTNLRVVLQELSRA